MGLSSDSNRHPAEGDAAPHSHWIVSPKKFDTLEHSQGASGQCDRHRADHTPWQAGALLQHGGSVQRARAGGVANGAARWLPSEQTPLASTACMTAYR